jgi:outer membrane lipoprotein-sorting protein
MGCVIEPGARLLPLPFGERAGVRGESPRSLHPSHKRSNKFPHEQTSPQDFPLPPTLSPKGRGSWSSAGRFFTQLFVLLFFCISAHAQNTDLLHTILTQLSQHTAIRAAFTQQRQNPALTQPQTSSGQLLFVTGHGMLWQVQQPYQQTLAFTGTRTLRIDADGRTQPMRSERGVSQISQMLQGMLTGRLDEVTRQFDVRADGNAAQWSLRFTPKQARVAQVLKDIQLGGGTYLQRIRIDMQDGTQTDIQMTDTRDAGPLTALEKHALGLP